MKILIDVNPLTKGKFTGIPYYGYKLIEALLAIYKEDEVMFSWFDGGVRVEHEDVIRGLHPNGKS